MNINLSGEIKEIEKALFEIENKHEILFDKLLSHTGTDISNSIREDNFINITPFSFGMNLKKLARKRSGLSQ